MLWVCSSVGGMTFEHSTSLSWYWVQFKILIPVWSSVFGTFGNFSYQSGLDTWSKTDFWLVWMRQVYSWYWNWYKTGTRLVLPQVIQILVGSLATSIDIRCMPVYQTKRLVSDNCSSVSNTGTYLSHTPSKFDQHPIDPMEITFTTFTNSDISSC